MFCLIFKYFPITYSILNLIASLFECTVLFYSTFQCDSFCHLAKKLWLVLLIVITAIFNSLYMYYLSVEIPISLLFWMSSLQNLVILTFYMKILIFHPSILHVHIKIYLWLPYNLDIFLSDSNIIWNTSHKFQDKERSM